MLNKIKSVIASVAKSLGFVAPSSKNESPKKLVQKTQRQISHSTKNLMNQMENVGKNVVRFNDPMTGRNYEVRRMLETGGDLHLIDADSRMASVLDSKAIKMVAQKRGAISSYIQDKKSTSSSMARKSFDKKHNFLSIEEQTSATESLGTGRLHEKVSDKLLNLSLDEVSTYGSVSEIFREKSRKKTSTSSHTFSSYMTMSKEGVIIGKNDEERQEILNKSNYSLTSCAVESCHIWDKDSYTQRNMHEEIKATENRKKGSSEFTSHLNEYSESITKDGIVTLCETNSSFSCSTTKCGAEQTLQQHVTRSVLDMDKNVLVIETEDGGMFTRVKKGGNTTTDSYSIRQSVTNNGTASFDWNFGHYTETNSIIENSTFSATGYWYDVCDFEFEITYENCFTDKRKGIAMSSCTFYEGDSWNEFLDVSKSLMNVGDTSRLEISSLPIKSSKN